ncbi:PHA/PHB synthase family protein [Sphingosinicella soli]|uniref:Polyhydroxyalkanoate synthase n=1 Tax=Sphingosinicella soli TaxID=333708 RepID=A0A7W7B253_9SPHN|nr:class I poly(R)-hydroxyalkanoic acid synthase [Sphingosinicella soli]MBB4631652.1 polyhydroxyalkanoate synthase [Sphingosinicella soli]
MVAAADIEGLAEHAQRWTWLAGKMQQMMMEFLAKESTDGVVLGPDPLGLVETWSKMATAAMTDPGRLAQLQAEYWRDAATLWQAFATPGEVKPPELPADKRFKGQAWSEMPAFDFLKSSYLLTSQYVLQLVGGLDGMDDKERQKALFYTRQFIDALSPSNYVLTNPEVLKATVESKGENLLKGTQHLLDDLQRGRMTMTDENAFEVGRNVAVTPGKVVFENRMFQLIQYAPSTANVHETPLIIFPPWINKFYILDLTPEKSFIRWAVAQGLTVFVVSWKNADASLADATTETYIREGFIVAIDAVLKGLGVKSAHVIGYCVAGTTLAMTLAFMAARGEADKVKTATFFTAQVDFSECGDLGVFVDADHLKAVKELSEGKGYLDGRFMATTFNMLRANDLIWNYVVNNYLLGKDYFPFDLLYWNSDSTNVPAKWHAEYLEGLYRDNKMIRPGAIVIDGTPIDLTRVHTPVYIQGGKEDHIAPARSSWKLTRNFAGPVRFVLAGSGHIAGVVNPPDANKYQHWTNDTLPETFEDFAATATEHPGSWWPDWIDWLTPQSGKQIPARTPGKGSKGGTLTAIEDAPGRYVRERAG